MYLFDGIGDNKFNDCHAFDFRSSEWAEMKFDKGSRDTPTKRGRHTCILGSENLDMFDEYVGIRRSNELFILHLPTNQWQEIKSDSMIPAACEGHSAVFYNGCTWLFGGWDDHGWYKDLYTLGPL